MEEEYIKNFISGLQCRFCGQQCLPDNVGLMEHNGDYLVFSVYCDSCKKQAFVTAIIRNSEEPILHPELNMDELDRFCIPVSSEDILDMHTFLKDFDGDFIALFPAIEPADNSSPQPQMET